MILRKDYNEDTKTQRVWYDSSMIAYTEMVENEYENKGDLHVTFKNGSTYIYKDVLFEDYIVFIGGGTDASQGKTLNKVIKSKYEFEKSENKNVQELFEEMNRLNNEVDNSTTYFISGHRDLTEEEFDFYYIPMIQNVFSVCPNARFVVGDCDGCDIMTQNYLVNILDDISRVTVYHVGSEPRNLNMEIVNIKGGFEDDREKDTAMTNDSIADIAMVRNPSMWSGTGENILRRLSFKTL
jgi:hypothetical protein